MSGFDLIRALQAPLANATRADILALEAAALASDPAEFPRRECPLVHRFVPGIYAREIFMPAGTFAMGKIHRKAHLSVILGDVSFVSTVEGLRRVTGMETFECEAGIKRAVYCHADTWWTTFHPNPSDLRDLAELERELIAPDFEALAGVVQ
jgi:hypothetical protein